MRRNYELFGDYVCFDMMKRNITTLGWPYTAIALYDENRQLCVCTEGFVSGEMIDIYIAMGTFLKKHATGRSLEDVRIVSGNGFFNETLTADMGLCEA